MAEVAIITPVYNGAATIEETVASVRAQTNPKWLWWILDDGSGDDSVERARRARADDSRIQILEMPRTGHIGILRNHALRDVTQRWVCFLDADDMWQPQFLEAQSAFAIATGAVVVHCAATHLVGDLEERVPPIFLGPVVSDPPDMVEALTLRNPIYSPSVMIESTVLKGEGGFSEHPDHFSTLDFDLWLRLAPRHRFAYNREALLRYRISPDGLSLNPKNRLRNARGEVFSLERTLEKETRLKPALLCHLRKRLGRAQVAYARALLAGESPDMRLFRKLLKSASDNGFTDMRATAFRFAGALGGRAAVLLSRALEWRSRRQERSWRSRATVGGPRAGM